MQADAQQRARVFRGQGLSEGCPAGTPGCGPAAYSPMELPRDSGQRRAYSRPMEMPRDSGQLRAREPRWGRSVDQVPHMYIHIIHTYIYIYIYLHTYIYIYIYIYICMRNSLDGSGQIAGMADTGVPRS